MNDDAKFEPDDGISDTIDDAEEVNDPLDGLVEKTASDPGAPFSPEALEALAALKKDDRAAFEALRAQLKGKGCRVTVQTEEGKNGFDDKNAIRRYLPQEAGHSAPPPRAAGRKLPAADDDVPF